MKKLKQIRDAVRNGTFKHFGLITAVVTAIVLVGFILQCSRAE